MDKGRRGSECWRQAMKDVQFNKRNSITPKNEKSIYRALANKTPAVPHLTGTNIVLQDLIAKGSFGQVIKGKRRNKDLAIKKMMISNETQAVEIKQEILALLKCQSPNILRFYGVFEDKTRESCGSLKINLVTEYLQHTLFSMPDEIINKKDVMPYISISCAHAIKYMKDCDIAHLDLKAGNIGYDSKGQIKLFDFGLCARIGTLVLLRGTVGYHAPEMLRNCEENKSKRHKVTGKEDIFSLGCTLFSLVNHHYSPFEPNYLEDMDIELDSEVYNEVTSDKTLDGPTISPYDVPSKDSAVRQFIALCLRKTPERRPHASELISEFFVDVNVDTNKSPLVEG